MSLRGLGMADIGNMIAQGPMVGSTALLGKQAGILDPNDMRNISKASGAIGAGALGAALLGPGAAGAGGSGVAGTTGTSGLGGLSAGSGGAWGGAGSTAGVNAAPAGMTLGGALKGAGSALGTMQLLQSLFGPRPTRSINLPQGGIQSSKQGNKPRGR